MTTKSKIEKGEDENFTVAQFALGFLKESSVHGFAHLTKKGRHPVETILWFIVMCGAFYFMTILNLHTAKRFRQNPTVVVIQRNFREWNTTLPAVSICPSILFTNASLDNAVEQFPLVKDKKGLKNFIAQLANVTYENLDSLVTDFPELEKEDYWKAVNAAKYRFVAEGSSSLVVELPDRNTLRSFKTDAGLCYYYTNEIAKYLSPDHWDSKLKYDGADYVQRVNPLNGDVFVRVTSNAGYTFYAHGAEEVPDISSTKMYCDNRTFRSIEFLVQSIVSSRRIKPLSVAQRKCRFHDESNLLTSPVYSYNLCRMECRMKECFRLCKCVPPFYRPTKGFPVCGVDGMHCLHKHKDHLIKLRSPNGVKVKCDCLPLCDEENFTISVDNEFEWKLGSNLKYALLSYPKFRYYRDTIFGVKDLVVAIGGICGLFLGGSILSLAEVFYYFSLRFIIFLCNRTPK